MVKNVTVDSVTRAGTDKTPVAVLHYIGDNGEIWKISNQAKNLSEETRTRLKTLNKGDKVSIEIKKEGNYWNLVSVGDPVAETTATKKTYNSYNKTPVEGRLTDVEKAQGQQRGNVLTNAVNLVIAFGGKQTVESAVILAGVVAAKLLAESNRLETNTYNDNAVDNNIVEADAQTSNIDDPEVTNELGW